MAPTRILLLATGPVGRSIAKYLRGNNDEIVRVYLSKRCPLAGEIREAAETGMDQVFFASDLKSPEHVAELSKLSFDFLVTVYWPNLLSKSVFGLAKKGTVNFHPAYLPVNRGWYPHVHSIVDNSPLGVTLHAIDEGIDSGPIWAQKRVFLLPTDTAKTIYERLQDEITDLFIEKWSLIRDGKINPTPQDHSLATYRSKEDAATLDQIDMTKVCTVEEVLRLLRARSFGDRGFASYIEDGERVYVNLRLSKTPEFG